MTGIRVRALLAAFLISGAAYAQELTLSPYSRYAVGDLFSNTSTRNAAMGGLSVASDSYFSINTGNPASFADLLLTTFEFSGFGQVSNLKAQTQSENQVTAGFQNGSYGFANKRVNLAFGFSPFSAVGYNINHYRPVSIEDSALIEKTEYKGSGGLNSAFIGAGTRLFKQRLRVGASYSYLFGDTNYGWRASVLSRDSFEITNFRAVTGIEDVYIRGGVVQYGAIFQDTINQEKGTMWRIGFTGLQSLNLKADRYSFYTAGSVTDTLKQLESGKVRLPSRFGVGINYARYAHWSIGADFVYQDWNTFQYFSDSLSLGREWRLSFGAEIAPDPESYKLFSRIEYRFGAYVKNSYLTFSDASVQDMGLTFGVGIPAARKGGGRNDPGRLTSRVNLSVEAGRRGNLNAGLPLEEYYVRLRVGASLNDLWFIRRVVD